MKITLSEFKTHLKDISFPVAVATSGGADSLALLLLTSTVAREEGGRLIALTVDHGLRVESKDEALFVQRWCGEKGIEHVILPWVGEKPSSCLQEKAREARYHLLTTWCRENQVPTLLLGHHQGDQEETFWMRLASGSGLDGLTGMKRTVCREGIICVRPLLTFPKSRLKATLQDAGSSWIEDPSNQNPSFLRGRLRQALETEGLTSLRLRKVMDKLREDADFIQSALRQALETYIHVHPEGYLTLATEAAQSLHPAITMRVIGYLMQWFSPFPYPPRRETIDGVLEKLKEKKPFTAGGIHWVSQKEKHLLVREARAREERLSLHDLQEKKLWDQRFWVEPALKKSVPFETVLAPLGEGNSLRKDLNLVLPPPALTSLPALWIKEEVVSVPHIGYNKLMCEMDLRQFIYSKPLFYDSLRFTI